MEIKFDFDAEEFNRKLKEQVENIANDHMAGMAEGLQSACDAVQATYSSDAVETVYEALEAELTSRSISLPYEKVRHYAEAIAQGRRVKFQVEPFRL